MSHTLYSNHFSFHRKSNYPSFKGQNDKIIIVGQIPKQNIQSEKGVVLIDFRQQNTFQKRTFNLKSQQQSQMNRTNSKFSAFGEGDLSTKSDPSNSLYTIQSTKQKYDKIINTEFVKIGMDYEAIQNEFSQSQVRNQKQVKPLFAVISSSHYVLKVIPKTSCLLYSNEAIVLNANDVIRIGQTFFKVMAIQTPNNNNNPIREYVDSEIKQNDNLAQFIKTKFLRQTSLTPYLKKSGQSKNKNTKLVQQYQQHSQIIQTLTQCRICFNNNLQDCASNESQLMISPCQCKGTMRNVHFSCLKQWIDIKLNDLAIKSNIIDLDNLKCDICKSNLDNRHYDEQSQQNRRLIDMNSITGMENKCVVHLISGQFHQTAHQFQQEKQYFMIIDENDTVIGRQNFKDPFMDIENACFSFSNGTLQIKDMGSKYGIVKLIDKQLLIRPSDKFRIQPVGENVVFDIQNKTLNNNAHFSETKTSIQNINVNEYKNQTSIKTFSTQKKPKMNRGFGYYPSILNQQLSSSIDNEKSEQTSNLNDYLDNNNDKSISKSRQNYQNFNKESPFTMLRTFYNFRPSVNQQNSINQSSTMGVNTYNDYINRVKTPNIKIRTQIQMLNRSNLSTKRPKQYDSQSYEMEYKIVKQKHSYLKKNTLNLFQDPSVHKLFTNVNHNIQLS